MCNSSINLLFLYRYFQSILTLIANLLTIYALAHPGISPTFVHDLLRSSRESSRGGRAASHKEIGRSCNAGNCSLILIILTPSSWRNWVTTVGTHRQQLNAKVKDAARWQMSSKEAMLANSLRNMKTDLQTLTMHECKSERAKIAKFKSKHRGSVKSWTCFFICSNSCHHLLPWWSEQCGRMWLLQKLASPLTTAAPMVAENILIPTQK